MKWEPLSKQAHPYFGKNLNIFEYIRDAVVRRNEAFDIYVAGQRGAGKSTIAYSICKQIDPNFTPASIIFTQDEYIDYITKDHPKGTCVFYDDIGTQQSGSSRKWQKQEAQDLADIMQVNRTDGFITVATSLDINRSESRFRFGFKVIIQPRNKLTNIETGGNGLAIDVELRIMDFDTFAERHTKTLWRYANGGRVKLIRVYHPEATEWLEYSKKRHEFVTGIKLSPAQKAEQKSKKDLREKYASKYSIKLHKVDKILALVEYMIDNGYDRYENAVDRDVIHEFYGKMCGFADSTTTAELGRLVRMEILDQKMGCNVRDQKTTIWVNKAGFDIYNDFNTSSDDIDNIDEV